MTILEKIDVITKVLDQKKQNNILLDSYTDNEMKYIRSLQNGTRKTDIVSKSSFSYYNNILKELKKEYRLNKIKLVKMTFFIKDKK